MNFFQLPLPRQVTHKYVEAFAPSNIALIKYWGKRDEKLNLPTNSSLSISLGCWGTLTRIMVQPGTNQHQIFFQGTQLPIDHPFVSRILAFLEYLLGVDIPSLHIYTWNNLPTSAGLASSASGFAALVLALRALFNWDLSHQDLSRLARIGSGSATRSLFWGFVYWFKGIRDDGFDSVARPIHEEWDDFQIGIVPISLAEKKKGSRKGMKETVMTSPLYPQWPSFAEESCQQVLCALANKNLWEIGPLIERNALTMHATMLAADPPLIYWLPQTLEAILLVQELRDSLEIPIFSTVDAGPNVKILFLKKDQQKVKAYFPNLQIVDPWVAKQHAYYQPYGKEINKDLFDSPLPEWFKNCRL